MSCIIVYCRSLSRGGAAEASGSAMSQCCSIVTSSQRREDNEDYGIHSDSFVCSRWIYISKEDEMFAWKSNSNNAKNNNSDGMNYSIVVYSFFIDSMFVLFIEIPEYDRPNSESPKRPNYTHSEWNTLIINMFFVLFFYSTV